MGFIKEFKEFAIQGNAVDLAVGIVIGASFGKIVSSLVSDVIMPPIGILIGGVDFVDLKIVLKDAVLDAGGKVLNAPVTLNYGSFIQTVFDFTIVAFAIFIMIKGLNRLKKEKAKK